MHRTIAIFINIKFEVLDMEMHPNGVLPKYLVFLTSLLAFLIHMMGYYDFKHEFNPRMSCCRYDQLVLWIRLPDSQLEGGSVAAASALERWNAIPFSHMELLIFCMIASIQVLIITSQMCAPTAAACSLPL